MPILNSATSHLLLGPHICLLKTQTEFQYLTAATMNSNSNSASLKKSSRKYSLN
ncbi:6847_t:CDS:2 [Dentiscutata erythropus]|uniref:6847_t:CDS:1 n=1 Tax=Dentiscutata erythropus TaxID=1348616 RepID=A0A9N8WM00_9GLOM|nr:6847_t:CDS:2 [Dentiscutata erythropus]